MLRLSGSGLAGCCIVVLGVVDLCAQCFADDNVVAAKVAQDVRDLAASSQDVRTAAEVRLYTLGPGAFPAIEAAASHPGLPAPVAAKLKEIIDRVRPWLGARRRAIRAIDTIDQWNQRTALAAYGAAGRKNPKWDAAASNAISLSANSRSDPKAVREALARVDQFACDDPLMHLMEARFLESQQNPDHNRIDDLYASAFSTIQASSYPPDRKFALYAGYARHIAEHGVHYSQQGNLPPPPSINGQQLTVMNPQTATQTKTLLKQSIELWPQVVKEVDVPPGVLKQLAELYLQAFNGFRHMGMASLVSTPQELDPKVGFDLVYPALERALPRSTVPLEFKGRFYIDYAWMARGGGPGAQIPAENVRLIQERIMTAEQALNRAWEMNPGEPAAPTAMLDVELLEGRGHDAMEKWFERAMKTDPDNVQACRAKMNYLAPRWRGSQAELLAFSSQLREAKNWYGRIPLIAIEAYEVLPSTENEISSTFQSPQVWQDVVSVYVPWLNAFPDDASARSRYTFYACRCHHWDEAKRQFKILGDNVDASQFPDPFFGSAVGNLVLKNFQAEAARH